MTESKRTPIGMRNGLKVYKPLKNRSKIKSENPLKRNYIKRLKSYKPLNKVSKRQKIENALWAKIKKERIELIIEKFGYLMCELCQKSLEPSISEAHHNNHDRTNGNVPDNCRILCHFCNCYVVEDNNIKDVKSIL